VARLSRVAAVRRQEHAAQQARTDASSSKAEVEVSWCQFKERNPLSSAWNKALFIFYHLQLSMVSINLPPPPSQADRPSALETKT
jgi:hypothetical protein